MKSRGVFLFIVLLKSLHYPVDVLSLTRYNRGVMEVLSSSDELRVRGQSNKSGSKTLANEACKQLLLRMIAEGRTIQECGEALNRSRFTLFKWVREPWFRQKLKELNELIYLQLDQELKGKAETTAERIREVSDVALDKVLELMDSADSEVVQMRCAMDILDRDPDTSKTHKVEKTTRSVSISAEFLRLVETSEKEAGTTIDG